MKKFSEEISEKLMQILGSETMQQTIASIRAASAEDTGSFEVIISTADMDRQGEVIDQAGWDLEFYKANPVVLWGHDYYAPPIGVCDEIGVQDGKLVAKGRFAPADANPFAQQVRKLYDAGMVRTTSVGFIAKEVEGSTITKAELLEFSFVPVPANPHAVSLRQLKELGIDREVLAFKGLNLEIKSEEELAETPAETPAEGAAAEGEGKGAVEDELTAEQAYELKWQKLDPACAIFSAFLDVYLKEDTDPDQFEALLKETIGLLGELVGSQAATEASENTGTVKSHIGKSSRIDRKTVENTGSEEPSTPAAPEGEEGSDTSTVVGEIPGGSEGEEQPDGAAPEQRSMIAAEDILASFKGWSDQRAVLRAIATITGEALRDLNTRERSARKK